MSVLPPEVGADLERILEGLQNRDNGIRSQSEEQLAKYTAERPEILLMGLVEQGTAMINSDSNTRSFAAVLFRRTAGKNVKDSTGNNVEVFYNLPQEQAFAIRQKLLESLVAESNTSVRNKIGDAVAELARQYTDRTEEWQELLGALHTLSNAADVDQRQVAFRIFATTPGIIERQHESAVLQAFSKGIDDGNTNVRLAAVEAFSAFFVTLEKRSQSKYFGLMPSLLNVLPPLREERDAEGIQKAFTALMTLAENAPRLFKNLFRDLVVFTISIIQDTEFDNQTRQTALELMATFADYAPTMVKRDETYVSDMITQCLSLMTDIGEDDDDAAEWNASEDMDPEESDLNHVAGEQCMDRLANKLGGATLLMPTFQWLPRMMLSDSWRDKHAALMAISAISEGCKDMMTGELVQVLAIVTPALGDPHPRVRWAGCNALGQMSTDFAGTMQDKYHNIVVPAILPVLDSPEPRVQAHAAAALVNFCEEAEKEILEPYLDPLLEHLLRLLQSPKRFVQEQALSTIATIADSAEAAFAKYYDTLMPMLFNVLRQESTKELRLLRAKAMECATLIALAVGKERLGSDAMALVELLATIQRSITDEDDPQAQYLMHCWGRMCRVLGTDFLPFLQDVMPPLLELAKSKADIQLLEDDEQVENMQSEDGWELVPVRGKVIGIKTSTLDDKNMAIELLVVYAQVLKGYFAPYVAEVMEKIALPGLAFFFHDPVRFVSAKLVPHLLNSYKEAYGIASNEIAMLWAMTVVKLLEVLTAEPAIDTLAEMYQCFYESVEVMGKGCLSAANMEGFIDSTHSTLEDYKDRVANRAEEKAELDREAGEDIPEDTIYAIEDDQALLSDMNKAYHTIFKHHGAAFLPAWERLDSTYAGFLGSADSTQRQWGLCIIDDVLEFCGDQSFKYASRIVGPLRQGCRDTACANRQAAAYGIGVAAQKGGPQWHQFVREAIEPLFGIIQMPNAREEDEVYATENACAAIAKALGNGMELPNKDQVIAAWLDTLPVVNDEEAAPYAYGYLVILIDQRNQAVMSQAPKVFTSIAQALAARVLAGDTAKRVVEASKHLLTASGLDPAPLLGQLSAEEQGTVRAWFEGGQ